LHNDSSHAIPLSDKKTACHKRKLIGREAQEGLLRAVSRKFMEKHTEHNTINQLKEIRGNCSFTLLKRFSCAQTWILKVIRKLILKATM